MSEQPTTNSTETGDSTDHHQERRNVYAELKAGMEKGKAEMEEQKPLNEIVNKPESRRYEPSENFRFLVHAPLDIPSRTAQLGTSEFSQANRPLNTTLIDQDHTWTFEGLSGLIIEPPQAVDVVGSWSYDSGYNDMARNDQQLSPAKLLEETAQDNYNQVNVVKGRVIGVYLRIKSDGSPLDSTQRVEQLISFARQHNLPVAEIVVEPQGFANEAPTIHKPTPELTTIEFNAGGKKYRIDALQANPNRPLPGDIPKDGYYFRAREIDGYGVAGGDVTDKDSLQVIVAQLSLIKTEDPNIQQAITAMIRRYSTTLE